MYHGIGSQVHYIPVPLHPIIKKFNYNLKKFRIQWSTIAMHYQYPYITV